MRVLTMTAAVVLAAGAADAATYELKFITDAPNGHATIVLELPSLANANIDQLVDMESSDECECGYFSLPIVSPSSVPSNATSSFRLLTNAIGKIVEIEYYYSEDFFAWTWGKKSFTSAFWADVDTSETYAGYWRVSAVPLPASALGLIGGLGALAGLARAKRSKA